MVLEILNKIAQILNKKKWAKTEENVNNITKIIKNFKINQYNCIVYIKIQYMTVHIIQKNVSYFGG